MQAMIFGYPRTRTWRAAKSAVKDIIVPLSLGKSKDNWLQ